LKNIIKIVLIAVLLVSSTVYSSKNTLANSNPSIDLKVINDTVIFNVPNAKKKDSIEFTFYYKVDGEYSHVGGVGFGATGTQKNHVYLQKNGDYSVTTRINNGKEGLPKYFNVDSIKVEGQTPDIYLDKEQLTGGIGRQFKGIYTVSPMNPPKNRSITMRMYTVDKNKFKLRFTQKLSPGQDMEIPRLKGVREYAFTYSVDGKESDYELFIFDKTFKLYEDAFVVIANNQKALKDSEEKVVKTLPELKKVIVNVLSNKKDEFITIKNKDIEKYFKGNEFPDSLLTKLFPNKKEKAKYKKLLENYHSWMSYSKKHNSKEVHLFPLKSYVIEKR